MLFVDKKIGINMTVIINLLSTTILQGIAFFSAPIFTRVLGAEQFGLYAIYNTWCNVITCVIALGTNTVIASGKYYFKDEYYNFRNSNIIFSSIIGVMFTFICVVLHKPICDFLNYDFNLLLILLLTSFSSAVIGNVTSIIVYEKKAILNFFLSVFLSLGNVLLSLFFIYNYNLKEIYLGRVYGHFFPYFIASLFFIVYFSLKRPLKIKKTFCKYAFIVGLPVVFHTLSHSILGQADRVMMEKLGIDISNVGIYSLYYSYVNVLMIILGAFNTSFAPFYLDDIDNKEYDAEIKKSKNYIEIFSILCIGFLLLSREVSYIMADASFREGIELIPIFVLSIYFIFMYHFPVNYEFYYKKTINIAIGTFGAAVLNIILNIFFIKKYGMYGAAFTTLISYMLLYIFHYIIVINMKSESKFQIKYIYFVFWFLVILVAVIIFYLFKKLFIIRWCIGIFIGLFEVYRIYKRKCIF